MDLVERLIYFAASMATVGALFFLTPLYTFFKALWFIYSSVSKEDIAGKVVLIVGASSGIGEHLAYEYARRGAYLVLAARREKSLRKVAEHARSLGAPEAIAVQADVSDIDDCKRLINETIDRFGRRKHHLFMLLLGNFGIHNHLESEVVMSNHFQIKHLVYISFFKHFLIFLKNLFSNSLFSLLAF